MIAVCLVASATAASQEDILARAGARTASQEDILEAAGELLYNFDEDEDGRLNVAELGPLIASLKQGVMEQNPHPHADALTPQVLMAQTDANKDGHASGSELVDLLQRMKGFDAGRLEAAEANTPSSVEVPPTADVSHEKRPRKRAKNRKGKKKRAPKDEV